MEVNAIVYQNTKTYPYHLSANFLESQPRGMAYVQDDHFVHIYGSSNRLWTISIGLTLREKFNSDLKAWVSNRFGATNIKDSKNKIGEVVSNVWRPGLYYTQEILQALQATEHEKWSSEQTLRILVDKLDDLLLYIEPSEDGLKAFSHKTRELLILACTEIENIWQQYMQIATMKPNGQHFKTDDYVKLKSVLFLEEYEIRLKPYKNLEPIRPFAGWDSAAPTQSLSWYDAYNKTKHDRSSNFKEATLQNCIQAVAANIVLFCTRYGPYSLFEGGNSLTAMINHLFDIALFEPDPTTFYIPKIVFPSDFGDFLFGAAEEHIQLWDTKPLSINP